MIKRVIAFLLTAAGLAFGQATTNSITVTASRNANVQPDQVVFGVKVDAPLTASRDDAVSALQGSGITLANLTGVTTVQQYDSKGQATVSLIEWTFSLPVAIADMKSTIALLSTVQTSNAQKNNGARHPGVAPGAAGAVLRAVGPDWRRQRAGAEDG